MQNRFGLILSSVDSVSIFSEMTYIRLPCRDKSQQRHKILYEFRTVTTVEQIVTVCMMEFDLILPRNVDINIPDLMQIFRGKCREIYRSEKSVEMYHNTL